MSENSEVLCSWWLPMVVVKNMKAWVLTAPGRLLRTCVHCHKEWEAAIDTLCSQCCALKAENINLKHRQPIVLSSVCAWSQCGWACVKSCVCVCKAKCDMCVCVCDKRWSWSCNLMTQPLMCVNAVCPIFQSCTRFMKAECTVIHTSSLVPWTRLHEQHWCHVHCTIPDNFNFKSRPKCFKSFVIDFQWQW